MIDSGLHIITQYYQAPTDARRQELEHCLIKLLESPWVSRVHNLLEEDTEIPEELASHPKHTQVRGFERLTYAAAFEYANTHLQGQRVGLCNSDIYLNDSCNWQPVQELKEGLVLCLSRHEEQEDGSIVEAPLIEQSLGSMSQDGWFFKAPIHIHNADFPLGILGCDNAIAHRIKSSGYLPVNQGSRYQLVHVDRCRGKTWDNFLEFHQALPGNEPSKNPATQGQLYLPDPDRAPTIVDCLKGFKLSHAYLYAVKCDIYTAAFTQAAQKGQALNTGVSSQANALFDPAMLPQTSTAKATRHYVTYCDKNYLVRALALALSIQAHEERPWKLYVICCDKLTEDLLRSVDVEGIVPIALSTIERVFPQLDDCRKNRDNREYYWTLTPIVIRHIFNTIPEAELCTYVDADTLFFSDPQPIFDELGKQSVLIHEHRFQASMFTEHDPYVYGRFNVGLMCFRRDQRGLKVLDWWQERCIEWCYARLEDGRFGDQKYLDHWPTTFEGVHILETHAAGAGPWNHENHRFDRHPDGQPTMDGVPVIHYHFHGLMICSPNLFIGFRYFYQIDRNTLRSIYLPYLDALRDAWKKIDQLNPGFEHGMKSPMEVGAMNNTILVHSSEHQLIAPFEEKVFTMPIGHGWNQCTSTELIRSGGDPCAALAVVSDYRRDNNDERLNVSLKKLLGMVEEYPANAEAWVGLGELLLDAGKPDQAHRMLLTGLKHQPLHARGIALLNQHFS